MIPSLWIRFFAMFIDLIISNILFSVIMFVYLGDAISLFEYATHKPLEFGILGAIFYSILCLSVYSIANNTIGKKLLGLQIVNFETREVASMNQAMMRYLTELISIFIGWGLKTSAFFDDYKRTFNDKLSGTMIVGKEGVRKANKNMLLGYILTGIFSLFSLVSIYNQVFMSPEEIELQKKQIESFKKLMGK